MVEPLVPLLRCDGKIVGKYIKSQGLQSVQRLNGDPRDGVPSLIRKRMVIQPLVRKHTPEKDKTEWGVSFSGLSGARFLPFLETKKF
jgi:hypothetical protein